MRISDWSSDVCSSDLAGPEDRSGSRLPQDRRTTVTASLAERRNPLTIKPDPSKAAQACRLLIRAYLDGPDGVEWSDVQDALTVALQAFHLPERSEEHTSELQSLMRISYAVFCLKKKT